MITELPDLLSNVPLIFTAPQAYLVPRKPLHGQSNSLPSFRDDPETPKSPIVSNSDQACGSPRQYLDEKLGLSVTPCRCWSPRSPWSLELLAILLLVAVFVTLLIVLQQYNGRTQTAWSYHHLILNGLVALLSTITRAALLVLIA